MEVLLVVVLGAAVAGFVQGLSGFAFGMVAMSFWAWVLEPQVAAVLSVFGSLTGQIIAAFTVRREFHWKSLLPFIAGGLLGIPIGVGIMPHMNMDWFKFCLGLLLILWCPAMLLSAHLPKLTLGGGLLARFTDAVAGMIGGAMAGLGGFSGTVPTLWCTLRGFERHVQRTVIQNFNLSVLAFTMASYLATGIVKPAMWHWFVVVLPAVLVPVIFGTRVYKGVSDALFRQIVLGLLICSGIAMLSASVPRLFFAH
ncbi:sulfite exporter TauE/SafE family protein [Comamonas sp. Y33R10-2]|uniref:sulfite exporter TauE/SafE family protein n=1 Tax=Comamonas sp. Y33R10-2 TaxID=2853257 RepID=UPI001C5C9C4A|nr:sulfite exporter TauE/SafE family protein [Comamonas sp. Y33R10-2]QXZ09584.1 sulfite exporter TauE/SafE family protein [Comamonas sp. Y33R10-2]